MAPILVPRSDNALAPKLSITGDTQPLYSLLVARILVPRCDFTLGLKLGITGDTAAVRAIALDGACGETTRSV
jgi:hypothetical protein